jgi:hypothetical protein
MLTTDANFLQDPYGGLPPRSRGYPTIHAPHAPNIIDLTLIFPIYPR